MKHLFEITKVLDNADSKFAVLLDFGHGQNTAGKRSPVLNDGSQLFEWEYNRKVGKQLVNMLIENRINFFIVSPESLDISLKTRVQRANDFALAYKKFKTFFLSLHADAFQYFYIDNECKVKYNDRIHGKIERKNLYTKLEWTSPRGIAAWTSKGQTKADPIATTYLDIASRYLPDWKIRKQDSGDGDPDFESNFYVLKNTSMPAVLFEQGFYSNEKECKKMMNQNTQYLFAKTLLRTIIEVIKKDII